MCAVEKSSFFMGFPNRDGPTLARMASSHHGFLNRLVTPLVTSQFAEDVVQEAWVKVSAAMERFEGHDSPRPWLAQIALDIARSWLRAHGREASFEHWGGNVGSPMADRFADDGHWSRPPEPWHHDTPEALLAEDGVRVCLELSLERLPPTQQIVIRLRDIECMALADIAAITGLSEVNVRVVLHRARQKVQLGFEQLENSAPRLI